MIVFFKKKIIFFSGGCFVKSVKKMDKLAAFTKKVFIQKTRGLFFFAVF